MIVNLPFIHQLHFFRYIRFATSAVDVWPGRGVASPPEGVEPDASGELPAVFVAKYINVYL